MVARVVVLMAFAVLLGTFATPETTEAHHVEAAGRVAKLQAAIRSNSAVAARHDKLARRLQLQARFLTKPPRHVRWTAKQRRAAKLKGTRQARLARIHRAKAAKARAATFRLRRETQSILRVNGSASTEDRALVSADGTAIWHTGSTPLAHVKVEGCNGSTRLVDAGDTIGGVHGPFADARSASLLVGLESVGAREDINQCGSRENRSNGVAGEKVTICHATGSATNPFVRITISVRGLRGHADHADDLIPAPVTGCPGGTAPPPPPPNPDPPPPPGCTITGAFVTLGDTDGIRVRFNEALTSVSVDATTSVLCVIVRTCNDGILDAPPTYAADGTLTWSTHGDLIEWVDVRVVGAPVARRYESHAKCPYFPDPPPPVTGGGGTFEPPIYHPTLLEPVSEICAKTTNNHAYLRSNSYRSIELRSCDGFTVRMYDDPMIDAGRATEYGQRTWPIGFGNGGVTLRDGTRVTWLLEGSLWTRTITVQRPGAAARTATAFGYAVSHAAERAAPVELTDAQVQELAGLLYRCRGSIANPLQCGGPAAPAPTIAVSLAASTLQVHASVDAPVQLTGATYGTRVTAFLDYGGSCAPSVWDARARPLATRQELESTSEVITIQPRRTGAALLCAYVGVDARDTADWSGGATSVMVDVQGTANAALELATTGRLLPGIPAGVSVIKAARTGRLRAWVAAPGTACTDEAGRVQLVSTLGAPGIVTWIPTRSGTTLLCVEQRTEAGVRRGQLTVEVAGSTIADFRLRQGTVTSAYHTQVEISGTSSRSVQVYAADCPPSHLSVPGRSTSFPTTSGSFTTGQSIYLHPSMPTQRICAYAFDVESGLIVASASALITNPNAMISTASLRVSVPSPIIGAPTPVRVVDSNGAVVEAGVALLDAARACSTAQYGTMRTPPTVIAPTPGRYRVCVAGPGSTLAEIVVTFVDDPGHYEAPEVALHTAAGASSTLRGSRGVVRRFMKPTIGDYAESYDGTLTHARVEFVAARPAELTWTVEGGTHGCAADLDARDDDHSYNYYAPVLRRSVDIEPGPASIALARTSSMTGTTICVELREDDGDVLRTRAILFPRTMTLDTPVLTAPDRVAAGAVAPVEVTSRGSNGIVVFAHHDAARPCQTLAAEQSAVADLVLYDLWSSRSTGSTRPLAAGSWRLCAYAGDWLAPTWFDTRVITAGDAALPNPTLELAPTAGRITTDTLQQLAQARSTNATDARLWAVARPRSEPCPANHREVPTGSIVLARGIAPTATLRGALPTDGSWRLCGWLAIEVYGMPLASAELVVAVERPSSVVSISAPPRAIAGAKTQLRLSGAREVPGRVEAAWLDSDRACPSAPDGAIGGGARAALDTELVSGTIDASFDVVPRTAGRLRGCAWVTAATGAVHASSSVVIDVDAPTISLTSTPTGAILVERVAARAATWTWSAPTAPELRGWIGIEAADAPCSGTKLAGTTMSATGTIDPMLALPAGRVRICAYVGVTTTHPLTSSSMVVDVLPSWSDLTITMPTAGGIVSWTGEMRVRGTFHASSMLLLYVTQNPCTALRWNDRVIASRVLEATVDMVVPIRIEQPGRWNLCATVQPNSHAVPARLFTGVIDTISPTVSLQTTPTTATPIVSGEQHVLGTATVTTDGAVSLAWASTPAGTDCAAVTYWPNNAQLTPGTSTTSIRITATASDDPGDRRICVGVRRSSLPGDWLLGGFELRVSAPVTGLSIATSGQDVRLTGSSTHRRTMVVGSVGSTTTCSRLTSPYSITGTWPTVPAGSFNVSTRLSAAPPAGTRGCLLAYDSGGTRIVAAHPFTF